MTKLYCNEDMVFTSPTGLVSTCRKDLNSLPDPLVPELISDQKMRYIVEQTEKQLLREFNSSKLEIYIQYLHDINLSDDETQLAESINSIAFQRLEENCTQNGMRYWEDISDKEYDILSSAIKNQLRIIAKMKNELQEVHKLSPAEIEDLFTNHCLEEILDTHELNVRICTTCGCLLDAGYVVNDGEEHYCSDECLHKHYSPKDFKKLQKINGNANYYTEFL